MRLLFLCDDAPLALEHACGLARMAEHAGHAVRLLVLRPGAIEGRVERIVGGVACSFVPAHADAMLAGWAPAGLDLLHVLADPDHWPEGLPAVLDSLGVPLVIGLHAALPNVWPAGTACVIAPTHALCQAARARLPATVPVHRMLPGVDVLAVLATRPAAMVGRAALAVGVLEAGQASLPAAGAAEATRAPHTPQASQTAQATQATQAARIALEAVSAAAAGRVQWHPVTAEEAASRQRRWWTLDLLWRPGCAALKGHDRLLLAEAAAAGVPGLSVESGAESGLEGQARWLARWVAGADVREAWRAALAPPPRIEEEAFFCESLYRLLLARR